MPIFLLFSPHAECLALQATTKISGKRGKRREASPESEEDVATKRSKKNGKTAKDREEKQQRVAPKDPPRVWDKETEKLKALVEKLCKGLPEGVNLKLPPYIYRGTPTDAIVQERIKAFLKNKGLQNFTPEQAEIDTFQKKVVNICTHTHTSTQAHAHTHMRTV